MPHKNRKYKKKTNNQNVVENKYTTSTDQLQAKEIEQVAAIFKSSDLSKVPLIVSLTVLQKKDAILKLLKRGCNINEFGPDHKTALMWSIKYKNLQIAELLLKKGADHLLEDQNGNNILFQALEDPAWEEAAFLNLWELLKHQNTLNIDYTNKTGTSLLHLAVKREWIQVIVVLIERKVNVNIVNSSGVTPLMLAAFRYNGSIVENLLQAGADVFKKDNRGRTALCYAISTTIVKYLQPPFIIIDLLLSEMEIKGCCLNDYLKYVVDYSLTETLAHIIAFTVKYISNGIQILLEVNFFKTTLKAFQNQKKDLNERKTLLMIVSEVLSHDSSCEADRKFFSTKFPQTCLEILQSEPKSDTEMFLKTASMHLLILACGDTEEGANFLKNNLDVILKNYDRCLENYLLQKYESDTLTNQTVQYKIKLFREQLHKMKSESGLLQNQISEEQIVDDCGTTLVTAIKVGVQELEKKLEEEESEEEDGKIKQCSLKELQKMKQSNYDNVDFIISYLEEVLQRIVVFYQSYWKFDGDIQETQQESIQIQHLQERFRSLSNTIKETFPVNPTATHLILDQLENLLLQHRICGKTAAEILTAGDFLNFEETGDQLYYKEILLLSEKKQPDLKLQKEAQAKTMENKYHLIPSIMSICDEDDFDVKRKPILKNSMSRWCGLLEKLHSSASNCVHLLGGDIRVCSREKMGTYVISETSGNFNPVEIGLDINSRPLAIKRIPKASVVCRSLKMLINPLLGLRNAHILHYFACDYEDNELVLATPLCEYNIGEYIAYLRQNTSIPLMSTNSVVCQFLSGLKFLHEFKEPIVHGNLKPSNIFVDLHGVVRIAEFGIYRALFQLTEAPASSTIWFARETYETFKKAAIIECTKSSDIHVAGMLLHFILTNGKHVYGEEAGEIMANLEKAAPQISTCDVDLQDLITWMLLYDPKERPTISQVLSHVFFWSPEKRWSFILTCSGIGANASNLNIDKLHTTINNTARKDDIKGSWVVVVKQAFPKLISCVDDDDTPTGLLRFIKSCYENQISIDINPNDLCGYILGAFPALTLSLYRMLESTSWLRHPAFLPFTK